MRGEVSSDARQIPSVKGERHVQDTFGSVAGVLLLWAGALRPETVAFLIMTEAAPIPWVYRWAPKASRTIAVIMAIIGALLVVDAWLGTDWTRWRLVVALAGAVVILAVGLGLLMTGVGSFRLQPDPAGYLAPPRPNAPFRYTYWSQRAIEVVNPNDDLPRFRVKTIEVELPGGRATFDELTKHRGHHAAAMTLERALREYIQRDPEELQDARESLLSGTGTIYVTAYGSQGEADPVPGGRVALFARQKKDDGTRIAICLFGSMENFDRRIQDMHPLATRGWAHSAALDVIAWIKGSEEWRHSESRGNAACKIAMPEELTPDKSMPDPSHNYERVAVLKQDHT